MRPNIFTVFATAVLLLVSCTDSDPPASPDISLPPDPLDQTPREDYWAEVVALMLSGELVAPQELYEEVRDGLTALREQFADSIPEVRFTPRPYWVAGEIAGAFTESAAAQVRNRTYTDMDSLNAALRLSGMDTVNVDWLDPRLLDFHLYFKGSLHPHRLIELYERLPSVLWVDVGYLFWGDRSQYYPCFIDDGISYLFRKAWGDCPSGCTSNEFWYFREVESAIEYVGHWDPQTEPRPLWWDEARTAFCEQRNDRRYCN